MLIGDVMLIVVSDLLFGKYHFTFIYIYAFVHWLYKIKNKT